MSQSRLFVNKCCKCLIGLLGYAGQQRPIVFRLEEFYIPPLISTRRKTQTALYLDDRPIIYIELKPPTNPDPRFICPLFQRRDKPLLLEASP